MVTNPNPDYTHAHTNTDTGLEQRRGIKSTDHQQTYLKVWHELCINFRFGLIWCVCGVCMCWMHYSLRLRVHVYLLPISSRLDFPSSFSTLWRINVTPAAIVLRYIGIDRTIVYRCSQWQQLIDTTVGVIVVVVAAVIIIPRLFEHRWRCTGQALIYFAPHPLHGVFFFFLSPSASEYVGIYIYIFM